MREFHFPNWVNRFVLVVIAVILLGGGYFAAIGFVAVHPTTINVGHQPRQPVPFSHKTHAGMLKLDCRYCHNTVEETAQASIPPTATCGNCHGGNRVKAGATLGIVFPENETLAPIRESLETNKPVHWERVHDLPDFVYFNHSAHVKRGVSCVECHGRVDKMEVVTQVKPLSMKWCLDCHRDPEKRIRNPETVTQLDLEVTDTEARSWAKKLEIIPKVNCSTCHR
jgi:menaquinone reductase, multiheme cytochrome c subunit